MIAAKDAAQGYAVCSCGCTRFVEYGGWRSAGSLVQPVRHWRCEDCGKPLDATRAREGAPGSSSLDVGAV